MELAARRWVGRLIRIGLVVVALVFVGTWASRKMSGRGHVTVQREPVPQDALGPGDVRILSVDSTVDLVLQGDKILAGLSPKTVEKVRADMEHSTPKDTMGIGGLIASTIKSSVAGAIGTHVVYPVADVREIRYRNGRFVLETANGSVRLFGNTKRHGSDKPALFSSSDVQRFVEAVRARKASLGIR
jgi:hypothetical protein